MSRRALSISIPLNSSGSGNTIIQNNNAGAKWTVDQIGLGPSVPPQAGCTCVVKNNISLVDTNYFAGTGGAIAGAPPTILNESDYLSFVVTTGPANGSLPVTIYFDETIGGY